MNDTHPSPAAAAHLHEISRELAAAVSEAGAVALRMFHEGCRSWTKGHNSPVTEADIAVDEMLRHRLRAFLPSAGWLSEETADAPDRIGRDDVWVVDPIDGTRAFVAKFPDWTISAALVRNGRPVVAALFAPVTAELYLATLGHGTTRNGSPVAANMRTAFDGAKIAGPKSRIRHLEKGGRNIEEAPRIHSLALRFARVASGELDAALAGANSHDWDLAAADLIVHEARGMLTSIDGDLPVYNRAVTEHLELAAAGSELHPVLLDALAPGTAAKKELLQRYTGTTE
jgi:myo-inositol-1(or 4)-monophosphatase